MSRMVNAAVCQPLAAKPRNTEFFARLLVKMERLRIELPGECLDLVGVDLEPAGVVNLPDGEIFKILDFTRHVVHRTACLAGRARRARCLGAAKPGSASNSRGIDQPESCERDRQRNEDAGQAAGPAQRQKAAGGRDDQPWQNWQAAATTARPAPCEAK